MSNHSRGMIPLLAQSFIDSRNNNNNNNNVTTFDMITSNSNSSPQHQQASSKFSSSTSNTKTPSPKNKIDQDHQSNNSFSSSFYNSIPVISNSTSTSSTSSSSSPKGSSSNEIFSLSDTQLAEKYQFIEEIGFGNWGSVWKCRPKGEGEEGSNSDSKVAIKLVHRSKNPTSSARVRSLWTEYKSVHALNHDHPSLIQFYSFTITPSYALIVMEFHPRLIPVELPESKAKPYFRQIISAVEYLHKRGVTHSDIKPSNILLSEFDIPILVDFGFSQRYANKSDQFQSCLSWGTVEYLSPERAKGFLHREDLSDIYSLGVTMYEIVVGRTPFEVDQTEEFLTKDAVECYYHRTLTGNFYGEITISIEFKSLIKSMIEPIVELRMPSCGTALRHKFFNEPSASSLSTPSKVVSTNSNYSTPNSNTKKVNRKSPAKLIKPIDDKFKPMKIYQDPEVVKVSTPCKTSPSKSTPSRVLTSLDTNSPIKDSVSTPIKSPSLKQQPQQQQPLKPKPQAQLISKIPISRNFTPTSQTTSGIINKDNLKLDFTPIKSNQPIIISPTGLRSPLPLSPKSSLAKENDLQSLAGTYSTELNPLKRITNPVIETTAAVVVESPRRIYSPKTLKLSEVIAARNSSSMEKEKVEKVGEDVTEVLNFDKPSDDGSKLKVPKDLPSTPLKSQPFRQISDEVRNQKLSNSSSINNYTPLRTFETRSSSQQDFNSLGRSSPIQKFNGLTTRLRQLSISRRSPSPISIKGIKNTLSRATGRRSTSAASVFSFVEPEVENKVEDRDSITLPLDFTPVETKTSAEDILAEKIRLESFSQQLQSIIDRKTVSSNSSTLNYKPELIARRETIDLNSKESNSILTASAIQEFTQQVAEELSAESKRKSLALMNRQIIIPRSRVISNARFNLPNSPRPITNSNSKLPIKSSNRNSLLVNHPSTPTKNRNSVSPSKKTNRRISSILPITPIKKKQISPKFKPGHRRIPTAIRSVPSISLTESADEESETETDTTLEGSEKVSDSFEPTTRIVEEARQLPTWVPESSESDSSEGETIEGEEVTMTIASPIRISSPMRLARASQISQMSLNSTARNEQPAISGNYQQFYKSTQEVGKVNSRTSRNELQVQPRPNSRASTTQSTLSLKRQVSSLFSLNTSSTRLALVNSNQTGKEKKSGGSGWKKALKRFLN